MLVGDVIKRFMFDKGITLECMAKEMNVSVNQVSRWRQSEDMRISRIKAICDVLGVSAREFYDALEADK